MVLGLTGTHLTLSFTSLFSKASPTRGPVYFFISQYRPLSLPWTVMLCKLALGRPLLNPAAADPNCSFFCTPASLEAAVRAKFTTSPTWWLPPCVKVILNCGLELGKGVGETRFAVKGPPRLPELEPLTCQFDPLVL